MSFRSVHEGIVLECRHLFKDLSFHHPKTQFAIKAGIATMLAVLVALFFHLQDAAWSGISAFLVNAEQVGNSLYKTVLRIMCTLIGITVGILCVHFLIEEPVFFVLATFFIMAYTIYRGFRDNQFYLWIFTAITFFMVAAELIATGDPIDTLNIALFRGIDITIGSIVGFIVGLLVFPTHAGMQFERQMQNFLATFEDYYTKIIDGLFSEDIRTHLSELNQGINANYRHIYQLCSLAETESLLFERTRRKIRQHLEKLGLVLKELGHFSLCEAGPDSFYLAHFKNEILALKTVFQEFLKDPKAHREQAVDALNKMYTLYDHLRRSGEVFEHDIKRVLVFHEFLSLHQFLIDLLGKDRYKNTRRFHIKIKNWFLHFKQNRFYLLFGVKVSVGMLTLPLLWNQFAIPGGSQLGVSMGAILNLDFNSSREKGLMRFYGCLLGAALALFAIIFVQVESTTLLLFFIFAVAFFFAFIHNSDSKIAYLGTQAVVAFLMGLVTGFAPTLILDPAVERLTGITFGVLTLFIILGWLWPFSEKDFTEHYNTQIDVGFQHLSVILQAFFQKPNFDFISSINPHVQTIKRNQIEYGKCVFSQPDFLRIQNEVITLAKKVDLLEAFLIFVAQHPFVLKKYQGMVLETVTAFSSPDLMIRHQQTQKIEIFLQNLRMQTKQGHFLPAYESILVGSLVRKATLLLQT